MSVKSRVKTIIRWMGGAGGMSTVLLVMVFYLIWASWLTGKTYRIVDCQQKYLETYSAILMSRASSDIQDRRAVDDMIDEIVKTREAGNLDSTPALKHYLQVRGITDRVRAANPLPPAPSVFCS